MSAAPSYFAPSMPGHIQQQQQHLQSQPQTSSSAYLPPQPQPQFQNFQQQQPPPPPPPPHQQQQVFPSYTPAYQQQYQHPYPPQQQPQQQQQQQQLSSLPGDLKAGTPQQMSIPTMAIGEYLKAIKAAKRESGYEKNWPTSYIGFGDLTQPTPDFQVFPKVISLEDILEIFHRQRGFDWGKIIIFERNLDGSVKVHEETHDGNKVYYVNAIRHPFSVPLENRKTEVWTIEFQMKGFHSPFPIVPTILTAAKGKRSWACNLTVNLGHTIDSEQKMWISSGPKPSGLEHPNYPLLLSLNHFLNILVSSCQEITMAIRKNQAYMSILNPASLAKKTKKLLPPNQKFNVPFWHIKKGEELNGDVPPKLKMDSTEYFIDGKKIGKDDRTIEIFQNAQNFYTYTFDLVWSLTVFSLTATGSVWPTKTLKSIDLTNVPPSTLLPYLALLGKTPLDSSSTSSSSSSSSSSSTTSTLPTPPPPSPHIPFFAQTQYFDTTAGLQATPSPLPVPAFSSPHFSPPLQLPLQQTQQHQQHYPSFPSFQPQPQPQPQALHQQPGQHYSSFQQQQQQQPQPQSQPQPQVAHPQSSGGGVGIPTTEEKTLTPSPDQKQFSISAAKEEAPGTSISVGKINDLSTASSPPPPPSTPSFGVSEPTPFPSKRRKRKGKKNDSSSPESKLRKNFLGQISP